MKWLAADLRQNAGLRIGPVSLGRIDHRQALAHAETTGDWQPIHIPVDGSPSLGSDVVVHGTLLIGIMPVAITAAVRVVDESKALLTGISMARFIRPVHLGELLSASVSIGRVRESRGRTMCEYRVSLWINADPGQMVAEANVTIMYFTGAQYD